MLLAYLMLLLRSSTCFRSMAYDFVKNNSNYSCPLYHQYMADLYPHTCIGYISDCDIPNLSEVKTIVYKNYQVLCHPRFQAHNLMEISANAWTVRCYSPTTLTFSYNSQGDVVYTCERIIHQIKKVAKQITNCIIAQKFENVIKCQYCFGYHVGPQCQTMRDGGYSIIFQNCPPNCKSCDLLSLFCTECWPGYSQLDLGDLLCSLKCHSGHQSCSINSVTGVYKFFNKCQYGYEFLNQDCLSKNKYKLECPKNCKTCTEGICNDCFQYYKMIDGNCIGDPNCMNYDIVYDSNGLAIDVNCHQCDLGYFHNGIECQLCNTVPGLEQCFLCNNSSQCKTCWSGYYLNDQNKCVPGLGCAAQCQTCLIDQPTVCTTCDMINQKRKLNLNNQCVCDQQNGWAEKYDQCKKCTDGMCQTCTLNFFECTSCKTYQLRTLIGTDCLCQNGYYEDGTYTICQKCHNSCENCNGPKSNNCLECGDENKYHRIFIQNQCTCQSGFAEVDEINIQQECRKCDSKCKTCSISNENLPSKCTSCNSDQNRELSDEAICKCIKNFGDNDGTLDKCYQCYYSCGTCIGELPTNCITCSINSNRYLTQSSECLCKDNYYEQDAQNIQCLRCHHSCFTCSNNQKDNYCNSCPSTRAPDAAGATFKCLCKDPHYFDDGINLECKECHYSCLTCNGPLQTNCLTCDENYRTKSFSICSCFTGFFEVGQLQCQACHFSCLDCFGNQNDQCISCSRDLNRILKGNQCLCQSGFTDYNGAQAVCDKCSYKCAECSNSVDTCTSCPNQSLRILGTDSSCSCPKNFVEIPNNPICKVCHYTCSECFEIGANQCSACSETSQRYLNNLNECQCNSHYYDVGGQDCQVCSNFCLDCLITSNQCISCQKDRYLQNNICLCKTKLQNLLISTFQFSNQIQCQACHYSCLTCNGQSQQNCLTCYDSDLREQSGNSCLCKSTYYDIGQALCLQCSYQCLECGSNEYQCTSCVPKSFRIFNAIFHQCNCQTGYFDDGINPICQQCHYSCLSCAESNTKCQECSNISFRQFDVIFKTCNCIGGYYDSGEQICQQCHYSCLDCFNQGPNACKTCQEFTSSYRYLKNNQCTCQNGYFDDGFSSHCQKCQVQCLNCFEFSFQCLNCPITRHLDGTQCKCNSGYFDTGLQYCNQCHSDCEECQIYSDNCTSCSSIQNRILSNSKCICQTGYIEINSKCQQCHSTCLTCLNTQNNCTECGLLRDLVNSQCICTAGTYESLIDQTCQYCHKSCLTCIITEKQCLTCSITDHRIHQPGDICVCQDGYFENQITLNCEQCASSCLTCIDSASNCQSCDSNLNLSLVSNICLCVSSYYYDSIIQQCKKCSISCLECINENSCQSCLTDTRYLDQNNQCSCQEGYYEVYQKQCLKCSNQCQNCINNSTTCTTCASQFKRYLINNSCDCLDGYFDAGIDICQKCQSICKTCETTSANCLTCFNDTQFRQISGNLCTCQPGYFEDGNDICKKCSNECQTCIYQSNYCTSCDINQKRNDSSINHKCPCITGYFSDISTNCQKCHIKCSGCINKFDNCISCNYNINSHRLPLSQNCICSDGYYDDGIQLNCLKCSQNCKSCVSKPDNCIQCFGNIRENPPLCLCKIGFYEDNQQICQQCDNQCLSCQTNPNNCLTCKPGRSGLQCLCEDGYFEAGLTNCLQCNIQCSICLKSAENCIQCNGNRILPPICSCPDGYYDDQFNECEICDFTCQTCNSQGCISCAGNRILSFEKTCDPPLNSICRNNTPWCSTCQEAVVDAYFSDDLNSILVSFDFQIKIKQKEYQITQNYCEQILSTETIIKFGQNPNCFINEEQQNLLILELGTDSTIQIGDEIHFIPNSIQMQNCNELISAFIFNNVKYPQNLLVPLVQYDVPSSQLSPCTDIQIKLKSIKYNAQRSFKSINWGYQIEGSDGEGDLPNFVSKLNFLQTIELIIPQFTLPYSSKIIFNLDYSNMIDQLAKEQIILFTNNGQIPYAISKLKEKYYTFQNINLLFQLKAGCQASQKQTLYDINLKEVHRDQESSNLSNVNYTDSVPLDLDFGVKIKNYQLTPNVQYRFLLEVFNQKDNSILLSQNYSIFIISTGFLCQINGTQGVQDYKEDLYLAVLCRDLDSQYYWNLDPELSFFVQCIDLQTNNNCININNKHVIVNETYSEQFIQKRSIQPLSIFELRITAKKNGVQQKFNQIIVFLEDSIRQLDLNYSVGYQMRAVNNYELLKFDFITSQHDQQFLVDYSIALIYNYQIVQIFQPTYHQFEFKLYDYFQNFHLDNNFYLKFSAQYSNQIMPSQYNLKLALNQPPVCQLSLQSQEQSALPQIKILVNCLFEDDYPFKYQLRYFMRQKDLEQYQNKTLDNSFLLFPFQSSNQFEFYLLSEYNYVLVQVMDSMGSIANIYRNLTQKSFTIDCSSINLNSLQLLELVKYYLQILLHQSQDSKCFQQNTQIIKKLKSQFNNYEVYEKNLVLQIFQLSTKTDNQNQPAQLAFQNDNTMCYRNSSKNFEIFFFNESQSFTEQILLDDFLIQIQKQKIQVQNLNYNLKSIEKQISSDATISNDDLLQQSEILYHCLYLQMVEIDLFFYTLAQSKILSIEDQILAVEISQQSIALIEYISEIISHNLYVNNNNITYDGNAIQLIIKRVTKKQLNKNLQLSTQNTDFLISFCEISSLKINYNFLNFSMIEQNLISGMLNNKSTIIINNKFYHKMSLRYYLNESHYLSQPMIEANFQLKALNISLCQSDTEPQQGLQLVCIVHAEKDEIEKNDPILQINNSSIQVLCQGQKLGQIMLVQILNDSQSTSNTTQNFYFDNKRNANLNEEPFVLFFSLLQAFSIFFYFELQRIESKNRSEEKSSSPSPSSQSYATITNTEIIRKDETIHFHLYPGKISIFKMVFKYIHPFLSIIFCENAQTPRSYLFCKWITELFLVILASILEIFYSNIQEIGTTNVLMVLINQAIIQVFRMLFKISTSIYLFGNSLAILIITSYFFMQMLAYFYFIKMYQIVNLTSYALNLHLLLIVFVSLLVKYFIFDLIVIFLRVVIYSKTFYNIKLRLLSPAQHLAYFFAQHQKLDEIHEQYICY